MLKFVVTEIVDSSIVNAIDGVLNDLIDATTGLRDHRPIAMVLEDSETQMSLRWRDRTIIIGIVDPRFVFIT